MRIKVGDREFPVTAPTSLSLLELLNLERETKEIGRPITLAVIQGMERDIDEAAKAAPKELQTRVREEHPDGQWLLAILVWSSMRGAGEKVTFTEAVSVPVADIDFIVEAGDAPLDAADPIQALPGSGQGAKRRVSSTAKKTSASRSTAA